MPLEDVTVATSGCMREGQVQGAVCLHSTHSRVHCAGLTGVPPPAARQWDAASLGIRHCNATDLLSTHVHSSSLGGTTNERRDDHDVTSVCRVDALVHGGSVPTKKPRPQLCVLQEGCGEQGYWGWICSTP